MTSVDPSAVATARLAWGRLEVVHTLHYFAPQVRQAHEALGLDDVRMGYVASRSAPLGAVGPAVVQATFYGFAPGFVRAAVPEAWVRTTPQAVIDASLEALGSTLRDLLASSESAVVEAAGLAGELARAQPLLARPLAAAWSQVAVREDPYVALWQAATVIRESRGDGHLACLLDAELDGTEVHLLGRGDSAKLRQVLGAMRGWGEADWDAAVARLQARGILDDEGAPTGAGRDLHARIERRTDELAARCWEGAGASGERLLTLLEGLGRQIVSAGIVPGVVVRAARLD